MENAPLFLLYLQVNILSMQESETLTPTEEVKQKAQQLSLQHKCNVIPLYFKIQDSEPVTGFFKEPPRFMKLQIMDKITINQGMVAASAALDAYIIKEESDSRIWDEKSENDAYYLAAAQELLFSVQVAINQVKKN